MSILTFWKVCSKRLKIHWNLSVPAFPAAMQLFRCCLLFFLFNIFYISFSLLYLPLFLHFRFLLKKLWKTLYCGFTLRIWGVVLKFFFSSSFLLFVCSFFVFCFFFFQNILKKVLSTEAATTNKQTCQDYFF